VIEVTLKEKVAKVKPNEINSDCNGESVGVLITMIFYLLIENYASFKLAQAKKDALNVGTKNLRRVKML